MATVIRTLRAGVYARLSLLPKGEALGASATERQTETCEEYAERLGAVVVHRWADPGRSGWSGADRAAFNAMIAAVEGDELDVLIVFKFDRLTRNLKDWARFYEAAEAHGVRLVGVADGVDTGNPGGKFAAHMLFAMATNESENISIRVKAKLDSMAKDGRWLGRRRPFGYRILDAEQRRELGVDLVADPDEAAAVREAADRILRGDGLRTIANDFAARGIKTVPGGEFTPARVRTFLLSPWTVGEYVHNGEVVDARWEPLLDKATWLRVGAVLRDPARRVQSGTRRKYLLIGLLFCGVCGARMGSHPISRGVPGYACLRKRGCGKVRVVGAPLDTMVIDAALRFLADDGVRDRLLADDVGRDDDVVALYEERREIGERERQLATAFARGTITISTLETSTAA